MAPRFCLSMAGRRRICAGPNKSTRPWPTNSVWWQWISAATVNRTSRRSRSITITPSFWADDVKAVIDGLGLDKPVLVGWSYGGFVMLDYVRHHGQDAIAGLVPTGGACKLDESVFGTLVGPGFMENAEGCVVDDLPTNIKFIRKFIRDCLVQPISQDDFEVTLAFNMMAPNYVRGNLAGREINNDDVMSGLNLPVMVNQGEGDIVVLRGDGGILARQVPQCQ